MPWFWWLGFPGGLDGNESACSGRPMFDPWVRKIYYRREWQPIPVFLSGKSHGWRSLASYSPWRCKESDTTEQLSTRAHYTQHFLLQFSQDTKKAVFSEIEVGPPCLISRDYFLLISLYLLNFRPVDSHCLAHTLCFPWYIVSRELGWISDPEVSLKYIWATLPWEGRKDFTQAQVTYKVGSEDEKDILRWW